MMRIELYTKHINNGETNGQKLQNYYQVFNIYKVLFIYANLNLTLTA